MMLLNTANCQDYSFSELPFTVTVSELLRENQQGGKITPPHD